MGIKHNGRHGEIAICSIKWLLCKMKDSPSYKKALKYKPRREMLPAHSHTGPHRLESHCWATGAEHAWGRQRLCPRKGHHPCSLGCLAGTANAEKLSCSVLPLCSAVQREQAISGNVVKTPLQFRGSFPHTASAHPKFWPHLVSWVTTHNGVFRWEE